MQHFNRLSPAQAERLALLAEECGEVVQVIGKILRHGYDSKHPRGGDENRGLLEKEIGDVRGAIDFLICAGDIDAAMVASRRREKAERVETYLHHQPQAILAQLRRM